MRALSQWVTAQSARRLLRGLAKLDAEVSAAVYHYIGFGGSHGAARSMLKGLEHLGTGWVWIPAPLLVALLARDPAVSRSGAVLLACMVLDIVLLGLLKAVFRRPRPIYNKGDMHIAVAVDAFSFPSGHASRVSLLAGYWLRCTADAGLGPLARGIILLYATSTVLSRVLLGRHYLGDVLAGVAVGAILTAGLQRALPGDTELCPPGLLSS